MLKRLPTLLLILATLLPSLLAFAQTPAATPVTADSLLDRIQDKADTIQTYKAAIRFDLIQGLLGDTQTRFGALYYVAKPKVKFAVDFQRIVTDGENREQKRQWIYDGIWLVERLDDKKQFFKRQVHAPPKEGELEKIDDPMSMENNPFPIPLQARKDEVLKRFNVTLITDKTPDDPQNIATWHLKLMPKPDKGINFTQVDLWYDQQTLLPVKCHTQNDNSDDEQIFSLFKPVLNEPISESNLSTDVPTERGWQVEVTPLKQ
jgi:hypothetical protein